MLVVIFIGEKTYHSTYLRFNSVLSMWSYVKVVLSFTKLLSKVTFVIIVLVKCTKSPLDKDLSRV